MSYCRFSDSDAYMFQHAHGGYECCACILENEPFKSRNMKTIFGLLFHTIRHSLYGNNIPKYVYLRILEEILTFQWTNKEITKDE